MEFFCAFLTVIGFPKAKFRETSKKVDKFTWFIAHIKVKLSLTLNLIVSFDANFN